MILPRRLRLPPAEEEPRAPPPPELCARCDYWPALPMRLLCRWCERVRRGMMAPR